MKYERLEGNATEALAALKTSQRRVNAVNLAAEAGVQVVDGPKRLKIREESNLNRCTTFTECERPTNIWNATFADKTGGLQSIAATAPKLQWKAKGAVSA